MDRAMLELSYQPFPSTSRSVEVNLPLTCIWLVCLLPSLIGLYLSYSLGFVYFRAHLQSILVIFSTALIFLYLHYSTAQLVDPFRHKIFEDV
jgi:hypothetical protein